MVASRLYMAIEHIIECFRPDRLIFGSDWPVVTLADDLGRAIPVMLEFPKDFSAEELKKVFHDNAEKYYKV